ncbi:hypothetical protein ASPZODRAFT_15939 [Penicilliopsis zonata CBS 506.65]|uniref:Uncharacterized protein n=1 Tax=Penicilliopsis zonata CBS 506.65 TaxID=1073090 RepID=A0A1L9SJ57_9EURO|nr:hypothetical protein ASPZODRAFT_15939 [Penicilliopsis zonata CBS 506.65]OJJ47259.1 hypothetical protein ASPZODRAFT_15939 [Penicilliopsis zonata CBS 506.65]
MEKCVTANLATYPLRLLATRAQIEQSSVYQDEPRADLSELYTGAAVDTLRSVADRILFQTIYTYLRKEGVSEGVSIILAEGITKALTSPFSTIVTRQICWKKPVGDVLRDLLRGNDGIKALWRGYPICLLEGMILHFRKKKSLPILTLALITALIYPLSVIKTRLQADPRNRPCLLRITWLNLAGLPLEILRVCLFHHLSQTDTSPAYRLLALRLPTGFTDINLDTLSHDPRVLDETAELVHDYVEEGYL